jgi:hypothetical protein
MIGCYFIPFILYSFPHALIYVLYVQCLSISKTFGLASLMDQGNTCIDINRDKQGEDIKLWVNRLCVESTGFYTVPVITN